jgi:hypothetical protein
MHRTGLLLTFVGLAAAGVAAASQSPEERAAARELIARRGDTVVSVLATVKTRMMMMGQEGPSPEENVAANATMLDARGLCVTSLSSLEPGRMMTGLLNRQRASMPGMEMSIKTETSNVRLRLSDGRELAARVVLRDEDLDLAFLRPTEPPAEPLPFIEGAAPRPGQLDLLITVQRLGEMAGWTASATFGYVMAVVDKPRVVYVGGAVAGAPVFDAGGRFLGVTVMMTRNTPGGGGIGMMGAMGGGAEALGFMPVVMPAAEIREVAKQAPAK